jgi:hypothetical protein
MPHVGGAAGPPQDAAETLGRAGVMRYPAAMRTDQPDLFASTTAPNRAAVDAPEEYIEGIRRELLATLALVEAASTFPWKDEMAVLLADRRFLSMVNWLPQAEADALRARFNIEMDRLYAAFQTG